MNADERGNYYAHWSTAELALKSVTEERDKLLLQRDEARTECQKVWADLHNANLQVGQLQKDLEAQKEDLWNQIKIFRDHNLKLYGQNCAALDALDLIARINPDITVEKIKEYAKGSVERIEKIKAQPESQQTEKRKCEVCGDQHRPGPDSSCQDV